MSYDFMIVRAPSELRSLDEIESASVLTPGDWRTEAQQSLSYLIPGLVWSSRGQSCSAAHPDQSAGRFELRAIYSGNTTTLHVAGSYHASQIALVQACAQAVGGYAFDMQSCRRIWPEESHGT